MSWVHRDKEVGKPLFSDLVRNWAPFFYSIVLVISLVRFCCVFPGFVEDNFSSTSLVPFFFINKGVLSLYKKIKKKKNQGRRNQRKEQFRGNLILFSIFLHGLLLFPIGSSLVYLIKYKNSPRCNINISFFSNDNEKEGYIINYNDGDGNSEISSNTKEIKNT